MMASHTSTRWRAAQVVSLLPVLLLSFGALHCLQDPLQPVAPSWDAPVTFPLLHRSHSLADVVERDPSMLRAGEGGLITYAGSFTAPPVFVGDLISITPPDTMVRLKFGTFAVNAPSLTAPLTIPWLPAGAVIPIPDTSLEFPDVPEDFRSFESVTFAGGTMTLTLRNNLPVPVELLSPVRVVDEHDLELARFVFGSGPIPPNSERSASDDLSERTTSHNIRVTGLGIHTSGSPTPLQIPGGDLLTFTLSTSGLRARSAVFADIPAQTLVDHDSASVALDDSTLLKEVRFHSGRIRLAFRNRVNLGMLFKFRLTQLSRPGTGVLVPYEDSLALPAGGTGTFDLDLAGHRMQTITGDLVRSLQVVSSISLPTGSGGAVTVHDTDKVEVRFTTAVPIVIDTAVAVIRPTWLRVDTPVAVDFGELPQRFSGQVNIPAAQLGLSSGVTFGFPMDLYLSIGARISSGGWVYLHIPASQKRIQPGASTVQFNAAEVGQFLSRFTGHLPDSLYVIGDVLVNPPDVYMPTPAGAGGIGRGSSFRGTVALEIPLLLGISDGAYRDTINIGDTTGDGSIDYTVSRERLEGVNSGTVYLDIENALPLDVGLQVYLLDRALSPLLVLPQSGTRMSVEAGSVDGDGNVTVPGRGRMSIVLSRADVREFDAARFVAYSVLFSTTQGSPAVRFRISDSVKVRAWSVLSWRVNG